MSSPAELIGVFGNRSGPRSRRGCFTCRQKKVKCDESRPVCQRCARLGRECDYTARPRKRAQQNQPGQSMDHTATEPDQRHEEAWSLSEQRERPLQEMASLNGTVVPFSPMYAWKSPSPPSIVSLASSVSKSGLVLDSADHTVIRYYRTSFSATHHTKNPHYSVFAIMFDLAESNSMVMHMILALSGRDLLLKESFPTHDQMRTPRSNRHYYEAIRLMGAAVQSEEDSSLESVFSALWLMILYEQKFGNDEGLALMAHLKGASSFIHAIGGRMPDVRMDEQASSSRLLCPTNDRSLASPFICRLIIWMAATDACAASWGLGGHFNRALDQLFGDNSDRSSTSRSGHTLAIIHRRSNPLFKSFWGDEYPQSEFMDDLKNRSIYALYRETLQMRVSIAELEDLQRSHATADDLLRTVSVVKNAIDQMRHVYAELLETASALRITDNNDRRWVSNIRCIVPHFHATVLLFYRVVQPSDSVNQQQHRALSEIVTLSFLSYKDEGDQGLFRMAWPLFMAGLESTDLVHQQWILDRFRGLKKFGNSNSRAHRLLESMVRDQESSGVRTSICRYAESHQFERFFI